MTQSLEKLIKQSELKEIMGGKSDTTIWRWRKSGLLPEPISINGRNYFRVSEIEELQERLFAGDGLEDESETRSPPHQNT